MQTQINFKCGAELRDIGMKRSLDHAEKVHDNWTTLAYSFLLGFIKTNKTFLAEDVRLASDGIVPEPPSNRAWGSVIVMAKKNDLIHRIGYSEVKNPKAHRTPATLWEVK